MTWSSSLSHWSLKKTVLTLLIPVFVVIGGIEILVTYRTAVDAANSAYDRSLLGAIKAIDANISTVSGGVSVELPYVMLEFFELTAAGQVYFRVGTEDGLTEIGSPGLPNSSTPLKSRVPHFYDAVYFDQKVRVGAYARELDISADKVVGTRGRIVIQVAETLTSRTAFIDKLVKQAIWRDLLVLTASGGLLALIVSLTLQPLSRLRNEMNARSPLDLTPIEPRSVPVDVRPLVEAINIHMGRTQQMLESRRRFIDDASHQLRTPLAVLRMQIDYALREKDAGNVNQALFAISQQLNQTTYRTNQMLSLAKADSTNPILSPVDLNELARKAATEVVVLAREKKIDLELQNSEELVVVLGNQELLREAILNLLHNAIRFSPHGGHVVIRVVINSDQAFLSVIDNGPGIPDEELPRMGERFFRASNTLDVGSGLGLAIARAVLESHQGTVTVRNTSDRNGCIATIQIPLVDYEIQSG